MNEKLWSVKGIPIDHFDNATLDIQIVSHIRYYIQKHEDTKDTKTTIINSEQ